MDPLCVPGRVDDFIVFRYSHRVPVKLISTHLLSRCREKTPADPRPFSP
jgi:hypothetical protein